MKKLTCNQLAGPEACSVEFEGDTLEEIGTACQDHVMEQIREGDESHVAAINAWKEKSPEDQQKMFANFQTAFDAAEEA